MGKSKGELLYEQHKGKKAKYYGVVGVIVGHDNEDLIMKPNKTFGGAWRKSKSDTIYDDSDGTYLYVKEEDIIP